MQFTLDHGRRGSCVKSAKADTCEANVKVGEFIGKRALRMGWLILLLIVAQSFVSGTTPQSGLSRTAPLPPLETAASAGQRQRVH